MKNCMVNKLKRLLKELGIYKVYISDRKKDGHEDPFSLVRDMSHGHTVAYLIDSSFIWSNTDHEKMWHELCMTTSMRWEEVIDNAWAMNALKNTIITYIDYEKRNIAV